VIDVAKERVFHEDKTISEIAYELGFRYPQHFSRLFKDFVGQSPIQYRNRNSHPGKGMPQLKTN
ncbi:MAG: helix-turn-helix domain-containing protein, partial [Bacteroidota bacterium]|nr:helix-turn-helix domain-containing protein [Bacteroidota bacterium]